MIEKDHKGDTGHIKAIWKELGCLFAKVQWDNKITADYHLDDLELVDPIIQPMSSEKSFGASRQNAIRYKGTIYIGNYTEVLPKIMPMKLTEPFTLGFVDDRGCFHGNGDRRFRYLGLPTPTNQPTAFNDQAVSGGKMIVTGKDERDWYNRDKSFGGGMAPATGGVFMNVSASAPSPKAKKPKKVKNVIQAPALVGVSKSMVFAPQGQPLAKKKGLFMAPALKHKDKVYSGQPEDMHADIYDRHENEIGDNEPESGFVSHKGKYYSRQKATKIYNKHTKLFGPGGRGKTKELHSVHSDAVDAPPRVTPSLKQIIVDKTADRSKSLYLAIHKHE